MIFRFQLTVRFYRLQGETAVLYSVLVVFNDSSLDRKVKKTAVILQKQQPMLLINK